MRDVDVDMDCPCSSSWQRFEVFLEVHCSEHFGPEVVVSFCFASARDGTITFDALRNNTTFWESECHECLRKLYRNHGSRKSLCLQSPVQHFVFSRVLGVS